MDQDSFRKLLTSARSSSSSLTPAGRSTHKAILDPSQPAFQPRKVKKKGKASDYRDRASERRAGVNEYAKVESVLEDFEQRTAGLEDREAIEEQRKYLGGDEDHTILVKGLDLALLEQNKARAAESHVDDDTLEAAFQEARTDSTLPKKRTRDDLIRELKEKRATGAADTATSPLVPSGTDDALEKAKKVGKFKPIGAPDNPTDKGTGKKIHRKGESKPGEAERKKKRRKVVHTSTDVQAKNSDGSEISKQSMLPPQEPSASAPFMVEDTLVQSRSSRPDNQGMLDIPEEGGVDVDIFADIGEYEGVDFGEDEDDEQPAATAPSTAEDVAAVTSPLSDERVQNWFNEEEPTPQAGPSARPPTPPPVPEPEEETEPVVTRLAPLTSSALPSISDFLAMDAQADAKKKKRAKKEKKQGEKKAAKVSTEVKVDRDYKKLNSYMAKKGGKQVDS